MQRYTKIPKSKVKFRIFVFTLIFVVSLLSLGTLRSFCVTPTPVISVTPLETGLISSNDAVSSVSLANIQYKYGSFNTYRPVFIWCNGDGVYLALSQKGANGVPYLIPQYDGASQWVIESGDTFQLYMLRLATNGFGLQQRLYNLTTATEQVIAYYDRATDQLLYNGDYYAGSTVTFYATAQLNSWLFWEAQNSGSGDGGDTVITETLDIGSIISAVPQAARSIIDGALGFEIFGINVAGTLTAILVVVIVGFVVKWLLSLKS